MFVFGTVQVYAACWITVAHDVLFIPMQSTVGGGGDLHCYKLCDCIGWRCLPYAFVGSVSPMWHNFPASCLVPPSLPAPHGFPQPVPQPYSVRAEHTFSFWKVMKNQTWKWRCLCLQIKGPEFTFCFTWSSNPAWIKAAQGEPADWAHADISIYICFIRREFQKFV